MMRINKFLAQCGVASRRNADIIVSESRVSVNGETVTTPGFQVDEEKDVVCVDGKVITPVKQYTYVILNKPAGYLTSHADPHHTKTVMKLVGEIESRINPVGRLDLDTEGALLLTDDGELAHRLTHPKYEVKKIYRAIVAGTVSDENIDMLAKGIALPDGNIGKANAKILKTRENETLLELILTEGRKREVKNLCRAIGHPVRRLVRLSFAGITCAGVAKGKWRYLSSNEIAKLKRIAGLSD